VVAAGTVTQVVPAPFRTVQLAMLSELGVSLRISTASKLWLAAQASLVASNVEPTTFSVQAPAQLSTERRGLSAAQE
jgi:hypothetical protein